MQGLVRDILNGETLNFTLTWRGKETYTSETEVQGNHKKGLNKLKGETMS